MNITLNLIVTEEDPKRIEISDTFLIILLQTSVIITYIY